MIVIGTEKAFLEMLNERGVYKRLGVDRSTVSNWKKQRQKVSLDKMEEMLVKAGASVVNEKSWYIDKA
jgi:hypothetical protein